MAKKQTKSVETEPQSALGEAKDVLQLVKRELDIAEAGELPKLVDSYARAANVVRQLEKDRKQSLRSFGDDELVDYMRALPERRRQAIITAAAGASLAGKPLYP